jgi:hypothetical protein
VHTLYGGEEEEEPKDLKDEKELENETGGAAL